MQRRKRRKGFSQPGIVEVWEWDSPWKLKNQNRNRGTNLSQCGKKTFGGNFREGGKMGEKSNRISFSFPLSKVVVGPSDFSPPPWTNFRKAAAAAVVVCTASSAVCIVSKNQKSSVVYRVERRRRQTWLRRNGGGENFSSVEQSLGLGGDCIVVGEGPLPNFCPILFSPSPFFRAPESTISKSREEKRGDLPNHLMHFCSNWET